MQLITRGRLLQCGRRCLSCKSRGLQAGGGADWDVAAACVGCKATLVGKEKCRLFLTWSTLLLSLTSMLDDQIPWNKTSSLLKSSGNAHQPEIENTVL
jgi:hypothetical protein